MKEREREREKREIECVYSIIMSALGAKGQLREKNVIIT